MKEHVIHSNGKKNLLYYLDTGLWLGLVLLSSIFISQLLVMWLGDSTQLAEALFVTPGTVAIFGVLWFLLLVTTVVKKVFGLYNHLSDTVRVLHFVISASSVITIVSALFMLLYMGIRGELTTLMTAGFVVSIVFGVVMIARLVTPLLTDGYNNLWFAARLAGLLFFTVVLVMSFFMEPNRAVMIERDTDRIGHLNQIVIAIEAYDYYNRYLNAVGEMPLATEDNAVAQTLDDLISSGALYYDEPLHDPQSNDRYEYTLGQITTDAATGAVTGYDYQLCANFEMGDVDMLNEWWLPYDFNAAEWPISAGRSCIDRSVVIDESDYYYADGLDDYYYDDWGDDYYDDWY